MAERMPKPAEDAILCSLETASNSELDIFLRWFDLPGLLEYADWTNLMSYGLHGIW